MVEYTIAAIPTVYKGIKYRSRLEARWAAFFDLLGFEFEYEPFDLGVWSPDFLLKGSGDLGSLDVLVEVKPITEFCNETAYKIQKAYDSQENETWFPLLCGTAPSFAFMHPNISGFFERSSSLGWQLHRYSRYDCGSGTHIKTLHWSVANVIWAHHAERPELIPDLVFCRPDDGGRWTCWRSMDDAGCEPVPAPMPTNLHGYASHIKSLWDKACDRVQWHPGTSTRGHTYCQSSKPEI
jgi:hypothetical protein